MRKKKKKLQRILFVEMVKNEGKTYMLIITSSKQNILLQEEIILHLASEGRNNFSHINKSFSLQNASRVKFRKVLNSITIQKRIKLNWERFFKSNISFYSWRFTHFLKKKFSVKHHWQNRKIKLLILFIYKHVIFS